MTPLFHALWFESFLQDQHNPQESTLKVFQCVDSLSYCLPPIMCRTMQHSSNGCQNLTMGKWIQREEVPTFLQNHQQINIILRPAMTRENHS